MKVKRLLMLIISTMILLGACSSNSQEEKNTGTKGDQLSDAATNSEVVSKDKQEVAVSKDGVQLSSSRQMVIYTAELYLEVKDIKKAREIIEEKVKKAGGYMIQSNSYQGGDQSYSSSLTVRIPQKTFEQFLNEAEDLAVKVNQRNVSGSDVSEEYVDLESRIKSKRAVESRLLEFMQKATTTEDLLKISNDLATVQEQIEQLSGRIKYLDNQIDYSTITFTLSENKITVPALEKTDLNTGEKIKKQFMTSINFIMVALSGAAVLVIGNTPILLLIGIIIGVILFLIKRKKKDH